MSDVLLLTVVGPPLKICVRRSRRSGHFNIRFPQHQTHFGHLLSFWRMAVTEVTSSEKVHPIILLLFLGQRNGCKSHFLAFLVDQLRNYPVRAIHGFSLIIRQWKSGQRLLSMIAWQEKRRQDGSISSRTWRSGPWDVQALVASWQGLGWAAFHSQISWLCPETEGSSQARFMLLYYCFSVLPCHFLISLAPTYPLFFTCGGKSQEERKSRKEGERKWGFGRIRKCQWPYRLLSQKERRGKRKERRHNHYDIKEQSNPRSPYPILREFHRSHLRGDDSGLQNLQRNPKKQAVCVGHFDSLCNGFLHGKKLTFLRVEFLLEKDWLKGNKEIDTRISVWVCVLSCFHLGIFPSSLPSFPSFLSLFIC